MKHNNQFFKITKSLFNWLCFQVAKLFVVVLLPLFLLTPSPSLAQKQTVISAAEIGYPPFSFADQQGKARGFAVDILKAALKAVGREVKFKTSTWSQVKTWLQEDKIQVLPLVGKNPERAKHFDFTFPYMNLHAALVVHRDNKSIKSWRHLKNKVVGVMKHDNTEEFLLSKPREFTIKSYPTFIEALQKLTTKKIDAVLIQRLVGLRLLKQHQIKNLEFLPQIIDFKQSFCFAVKKGNHKLLDLLNEGLSIIMADGTYRHLHTKWFAALQLPKNNRIVIGGDNNFPPFEYLDNNGQPSGYNVELTKAIARKLGLEITIKLAPWNKIKQQLSSGEIDLLQGMFYSLQRDLVFDFSRSHTIAHYISVVRKKDGNPPKTLAQLAKYKILVQNNDIIHDYLLEQNIKNTQLVLAKNQMEALDKLDRGQADCALVSQATLNYYLNQNQNADLVGSDTPFLSPKYCYASLDNRDELIAKFNQGLAVLEKSGELRKLQEKWFGLQEQKSSTVFQSLRNIALFVFILLLIFLILFLWFASLRRQVALKTRELQKSTELQRAIIACTPVAFYSTDTQGRVMTWNSSTEKLFGYKAQKVIGKPLPIIPSNQKQEIEILRDNLMRSGEFSGIQTTRQHKNGKIIPVHISMGPIYDENKNVIGIMSSAKDISDKLKANEERKKLQAQLLQAQKMEAIGQLAGGVAHDYNNMLSVIIGYTELSLENLPEENPLHDNLKEILTASKRSVRITRQLLAFARKQTINPKTLNLNEVVEGMLKMLRRLIGEDIKITWQPGSGLGKVKIDPMQVDQILANLCINARDAISGVGEITIATSNIELDEQFCLEHNEVIPGHYVKLAVQDNGCGMDQETQDNIFLPFYTTKELNKGTGLGLSTVYGIVKQNNGYIYVESEPGKGASFNVYLPHSQSTEFKNISTPSTKLTVGDKETILLVEDEPSILKMTQRMLEKLNYQVLPASTPEQALGLANNHKNRINLLVTDVIMPFMNGYELSLKIKEIIVDLEVLYVSGYSANVIAEQGLLKNDVNFLAKPFTIKTLAEKVKKSLPQK
ncbi:MAG: transporter substrate-binding domain-containing protein [Myxococcota bacterium]